MLWFIECGFWILAIGIIYKVFYTNIGTLWNIGILRNISIVTTWDIDTDMIYESILVLELIMVLVWYWYWYIGYMNTCYMMHEA